MASSDTLIEAHKIEWRCLYHKILHCYHLVLRRLQVYTGTFLLLVSQWVVHFLQFCLLRAAKVLRANYGLCRMARGYREKAWRRSFADTNDDDQSGQQVMINLGIKYYHWLLERPTCYLLKIKIHAGEGKGLGQMKSAWYTLIPIKILYLHHNIVVILMT